MLWRSNMTAKPQHIFKISRKSFKNAKLESKNITYVYLYVWGVSWTRLVPRVQKCTNRNWITNCWATRLIHRIYIGLQLTQLSTEQFFSKIHDFSICCWQISCMSSIFPTMLQPKALVKIEVLSKMLNKLVLQWHYVGLFGQCLI